jgi:hypothetical protein
MTLVCCAFWHGSGTLAPATLAMVDQPEAAPDQLLPLVVASQPSRTLPTAEDAPARTDTHAVSAALRSAKRSPSEIAPRVASAVAAPAAHIAIDAAEALGPMHPSLSILHLVKPDGGGRVEFGPSSDLAFAAARAERRCSVSARRGSAETCGSWCRRQHGPIATEVVRVHSHAVSHSDCAPSQLAASHRAMTCAFWVGLGRRNFRPLPYQVLLGKGQTHDCPARAAPAVSVSDRG